MTEKNHITEINFEAGDHAMPQDSPRPEPAETLTVERRPVATPFSSCLKSRPSLCTTTDVQFTSNRAGEV
jgi:hypothetical protein